MKFELGKYYQHTTGAKLYICGLSETYYHGSCFIGENENGKLSPIGKGEANSENWYEITKERFIEKSKHANLPEVILKSCIDSSNSSLIFLDGKNKEKLIMDISDHWKILPEFGYDEKITYQSVMNQALFKYIYLDGTIKYNDFNRCVCVDIASICTEDVITYQMDVVDDIINDMYPITMPYEPGETIKVYCEDFKVNKEMSTFDTFGVLYLLKTDSEGNEEFVNVSKFYKIHESTADWQEIEKTEFSKRLRCSL